MPAKSSTPSCSVSAAAFVVTASIVSGVPFTHSSGHARTITSAGAIISATWSQTCFSPTWVNGQVMSANTSTVVIPPRVSGRRLGPCDGQTAHSSPGAPDGKNSGSSDKEKPSAVETAIAEDAKEVSQAGREEVKQVGIEEVKKGVRGMFEKLFE